MSRSQITLYKWNPVHEILYPREVEFMTFPGGEEHVKSDLDDYPDTTYVIDARLSDSAGILRVLLLTDLIRTRVRRPRIHLFAPYLPAARQDRGAPLSAKVYADLINSGDYESVVSVDPHSDVMPALIRNEYHIPLEEVFPHANGPFPGPARAVLVIPDAGAGKRVGALATKFGYNTRQALKHRDSNTGQLSKFTCEPIPPAADAIIIDDICDGGGTFLGLADVIKEQWKHAQYGNPRLHLWTTHGIYSKGLSALAEVFTTIASTDSFPVQVFSYTPTPQGQEAHARAQLSNHLTRVPLSDTLQSLANKGFFN